MPYVSLINEKESKLKKLLEPLGMKLQSIHSHKREYYNFLIMIYRLFYSSRDICNNMHYWKNKSTYQQINRVSSENWWVTITLIHWRSQFYFWYRHYNSWWVAHDRRRKSWIPFGSNPFKTAISDVYVKIFHSINCNVSYTPQLKGDRSVARRLSFCDLIQTSRNQGVYKSGEWDQELL
jgi:hypothetical protein